MLEMVPMWLRERLPRARVANSHDRVGSTDRLDTDSGVE
jgi:hypothetical protein